MLSRSYPPDVFPGLWVYLDKLITEQQVLCPDEVRVELARQDDDLAKWINARPHLFVPLDDVIQRATSNVLAQHLDTLRNTLRDALSDSTPAHAKTVLQTMIDGIRVDARDQIDPTFRVPAVRIDNGYMEPTGVEPVR